MQPLGPAAVTAALTGLDQKLLVRLARDLLVVRGHVDVRETDGPGDATRDVFSVTREGRRHLCQCKYHGDAAKAVTNNEVGELVLGLVKHGYRSGTFLTNARITSAAKRELIDNYPDYTLEFIDGQELFAEVLAHEVLRSLWIEGENVRLVSTRAAVPLIARVHDGDTPFALQANDGGGDILSQCAVEIANALPGVNVRTGYHLGCPVEAFEPYRPPGYLRFEEGGHHGVAAAELVLLGRISAEDLSNIARTAASRIAEALSARFGSVGVVAGRPFFLSGSGIRKDERTLTGLSGARYIGLDGAAYPEADWFLPEREPWSPACVASTTQTGSVRLYSRDLDAALDYEIEVPVSPWERLLLQRTRDGWERSVFALIEPGTDLAALGLPEPYITIPWTYENLGLAWWRHEYFFRDGLIAFPTVLRDDELDYHAAFRAEEAAETARLEGVRKQLGQQDGLRLVEPQRARFMVAVMLSDPLAEPSTSVYRTGDVFSAFSGIPSPIPPTARRFEAIVAWKPAPENDTDALLHAVERALPGGDTQDSVEEDAGYVVVSRRYLKHDARKRTQDVVAAIATDIASVVEVVESAIPDGARRATRDYWSRAHGVELGRWWGQSDERGGSADQAGEQAWPRAAVPREAATADSDTDDGGDAPGP